MSGTVYPGLLAARNRWALWRNPGGMEEPRLHFSENRTPLYSNPNNGISPSSPRLRAASNLGYDYQNKAKPQRGLARDKTMGILNGKAVMRIFP
jgi:hypothetical protein